MVPKEIAEEAIKRMNKRITNEIFLIMRIPGQAGHDSEIIPGAIPK